MYANRPRCQPNGAHPQIRLPAYRYSPQADLFVGARIEVYLRAFELSAAAEYTLT
jgi:hypothetical protein